MTVGSKVRARPLRVAIDARLRHGESGGVESVTVGLADGLSALDGEEEYFFLTIRGEDDWIAPHLRGNAQPLRVKAAVGPRSARVRAFAKRAIPGAPALARRTRIWRQRYPPQSSGEVESAGIDVMHFVKQTGFLTPIPSIYHPHDLQHVHLPAMFDQPEREFRDRWYGALCAQAKLVAVASSWTRNDMIRQMDLPPEKVQVVPWAPPIDVESRASVDEIQAARLTLKLPERFLLYPAQTWPHKNHVGLLEAIEILRRRDGLVVPLVFSGRRNAQAQTVDAAVDRLHLASQVTWLEFIPSRLLRAVYQSAAGVIIPSCFEAASGPLWEAFAVGVPAACSNVTSLPEQAGDAALVFDPNLPSEIADAVQRLWTDQTLTARLVERGTARVKRFTWSRTARHFRAHYRRLGGRPLTPEDKAILLEPPGL